MTIRSVARFAAVVFIAAGCSDMTPLGPAGPSTGTPPQTTLTGPVWMTSGSTLGLNSPMIYSGASNQTYPSSVCWIGDFNNWSTNCAVSSDYDSNLKGHVFPLAAAQSAGVNSVAVNNCTRVTFYNRSNSSAWLPIEEFIVSKGGINSLTAEQRGHLRADSQNRYLPAFILEKDSQGTLTRARPC